MAILIGIIIITIIIVYFVLYQSHYLFDDDAKFDFFKKYPNYNYNGEIKIKLSELKAIYTLSPNKFVIIDGPQTFCFRPYYIDEETHNAWLLHFTYAAYKWFCHQYIIKTKNKEKEKQNKNIISFIQTVQRDIDRKKNMMERIKDDNN